MKANQSFENLSRSSEAEIENTFNSLASEVEEEFGKYCNDKRISLELQ